MDNETNTLDYGKQPANNPGALQLKSKQLYPKQFSKGRVLKQQLSRRMLQLLSDTKMIAMSLLSILQDGTKASIIEVYLFFGGKYRNNMVGGMEHAKMVETRVLKPDC